MPTGKIGIISDLFPEGNPLDSMTSREISLYCAQNNLNMADYPTYQVNQGILKRWVKPNDPNTGGWLDIVKRQHFQHPDFPNFPEMGMDVLVNNFTSGGDYSQFAQNQCVILDSQPQINWEANVLVDIDFNKEDPNDIVDSISGDPIQLGPYTKLSKTCQGTFGLSFIEDTEQSYLAVMNVPQRLSSAIVNGMTNYAIYAKFESKDCTSIHRIYDGDVLCSLESNYINASNAPSFTYPDPIAPAINTPGSSMISAVNSGNIGTVQMSLYNDQDSNFSTGGALNKGLIFSYNAGNTNFLYIVGKSQLYSFYNAVLTRFIIVDMTPPATTNPKEVLHVDFSLPTPIDLVSGKALTAGTYGRYNSQYKYWYKSNGTYTNPIAYIQLSELPVLQNELRNILTNNAKYRIICESYQQSASNANMNILKFGTGSPENASNLAGAFGLASAQINNASTTYNDSTLFRYNVAYRNGTGHDFTTWKNTTQLDASQNTNLSYALKQLNINQLNNYYLLFGCGNNNSNTGRATFLKTVIIERV